MDFSEELSLVASAWQLSHDEKTRAELVRSCAHNGLKAEWRLTRDGWELIVRKAG